MACIAVYCSRELFPIPVTYVYIIIVIHWVTRIMAVNDPIPRAEPEGEVCLRRHNSLATSE